MLVMIPFTTVIVFASADKKDPDAPVFWVAIVPRPRFVLAPAAVVAPVPPLAKAIVVAFHVPTVSVPTPVIPVYEPLSRPVGNVPEVMFVAFVVSMVADGARPDTALAAMAIGVLTELVKRPCALTA